MNLVSRPPIRSSSIAPASCTRGSGIWSFELRSGSKLEVVEGGRSVVWGSAYFEQVDARGDVISNDGEGVVV